MKTSSCVARRPRRRVAIQGEAGGASAGRSPFVWMLAIVFVVGIVVVFLMTRGAERAPRHSR